MKYKKNLIYILNPLQIIVLVKNLKNCTLKMVCNVFQAGIFLEYRMSCFLYWKLKEKH